MFERPEFEQNTDERQPTPSDKTIVTMSHSPTKFALLEAGVDVNHAA